MEDQYISLFTDKFYVKRVKTEYKKLSPTPDNYQAFKKQISDMWSRVSLSTEELEQISVPTWIVVGNHGVIKETNTNLLFEHIPCAEKLILPSVGHFAYIQRPAQFKFNQALWWFLRWNPVCTNSVTKP